MIETDNLTYQYKRGEPVLNFPNINLGKGENLLILGDSGIGKTTLLHLLAGLLKPATGNIYFDNVILKTRLLFSDQSVNVKKIENVLEQLGLIEVKNNKINELSEGQLQRLGIALSVIHNPKVILADEPTSSLDDKNCKIVIQLLIHQAEQTNTNLIVITHDQRIKSFFQNSIVL
jgi:putative ABC transport system ATP-binding protein